MKRFRTDIELPEDHEPNLKAIKIKSDSDLTLYDSTCKSMDCSNDSYSSGHSLPNSPSPPQTLLRSSQELGGKLKPSNFTASKLQIGCWERNSAFSGDVVVKFYYIKKQIVWEVLELGLKSKMEINFSDITALEIQFGEDDKAVMIIDLIKPPRFFREINPQPKKNTMWTATSDFTRGQASTHKRHIANFGKQVLRKHYEKLLQSDLRIKQLTEQGIGHPVDLTFQGISLCDPVLDDPTSSPITSH